MIDSLETITITEDILHFLEELLLENQAWFVENKKFIQEHLREEYELHMETNKWIKKLLKQAREKLRVKAKRAFA